MKHKALIAIITLSVLPLFAIAAAQNSDHQSSQAAMQQNTGPGMTMFYSMGHGMMSVIDRVENDLGSLAKVNDAGVLHKRIAQDRGLLNRSYSHMGYPMHGSARGMAGSMMYGPYMMSNGMMSGRFYNCYGYGTGQQAQQ